MQFDPTIAKRIERVEIMKDDKRESGVEISNPTLGSLKIRGTDWVGIVSLVLLVVLGLGGYTTVSESKMQITTQNAAMVTVLRELADAQKDANKQGKLLACIVSRPEAERKREFESDNSFCQRFSRP